MFIFARLLCVVLQVVDVKGLWPHFSTTTASAVMPLDEPKGVLAQYATCIMEVLERSSTLIVSGTAVVENPVRFPGDMRCLYAECNSTSFVQVPVTADCPLGRMCGEPLPHFCWVLIEHRILSQ